MRVVPAWLAWPAKSNRNRPCGQIPLPTPTAACRSTRSRPCSTCSSTKDPTSARRSASPSCTPDTASSSDTPLRSVRAAARSQGSDPVARREPRQARPNRDPSSSTKTATPSGRAGRTPRSRSRSIAASADTTPSGPSYAPPSGTESRWEPVSTPVVSAGSTSGGRHQAARFPNRSRCTSSERCAHCSRNHAKASRSADPKGRRSYPPLVEDRPTGARSRHICSKSAVMIFSMEFQDVVRRRRMVRNYAEDPVDPAVVDRMLHNATHAPSAGFSQGWGFLRLDTPEDLRRYWAVTAGEEALAQPDEWLAGMVRAPVLIVPCSNKSAYLARYAERDKGWTDRDESRWPVPFWHLDTAMATLLILQTAVDAGLGACFFGIPPERTGAFRVEFGVARGYTPGGAVTRGSTPRSARSRSGTGPGTRGPRAPPPGERAGRWSRSSTAEGGEAVAGMA